MLHISRGEKNYKEVSRSLLVSILNLSQDYQLIFFLSLDDQSQHALLHDLASSRVVIVTQEGKLVSFEELQFMDLNIVRAAIDDFADSNKLVQGGFGTVYKVMPSFSNCFELNLSLLLGHSHI